jgi:predicted  nucleic acid-binding Zn-ribbon protein
MTTTNTNELKASLQRELDALTRARDELKVQLHLAKNEARDEWTKLEAAYARLTGELQNAGGDLKEPIRELSGAARSVFDELKHGYDRIRKSFISH